MTCSKKMVGNVFFLLPKLQPFHKLPMIVAVFIERLYGKLVAFAGSVPWHHFLNGGSPFFCLLDWGLSDGNNRCWIRAGQQFCH